MLGRSGKGMGMVMLHADAAQAETFGHAARGEIRVPVMRDGNRLRARERNESPRRLLKGSDGGRVFKIANMGREDRLRIAQHAGGGLEMAAQRQHIRPVSGKADRAGCRTPATAQQARRIVDPARDAVIGPRCNRPVMADHEIGDRAQPSAASASSNITGAPETFPLVITSTASSPSASRRSA